MKSEFKMPSLGADMEAGTLVEWLVSPGDRVARGDIVAIVETQKGAIDVEIYQDGVIEEIVIPVGTEVPVGAVLATLEVEGGVAAAEHEVSTQTQRQAPPKPAPAGAEPAPQRQVPPAVTPSPRVPSAETPSARASSKKVSPRARRLAERLGVDCDALTGTGPGGSVTAQDVERAASEPKPSGMRDAIAASMVRSNREIPQYRLQHVIDLEPMLRALEEDNRERWIRDRILPIAVLVRAVARALGEHQELNGWVRDGRFVPGDGIHVGLAVALRDGGLVNPALHHADQGSLVELWSRIRDVTTRARQGGLRSSEFAEATITITSLGDRGVDVVHGIIVPPQVAMVGFGTIRSRPWVVDDAIEPRRLIEASLAADHRVTDGHTGARFLHTLATLLAQPEQVMQS